jgi:hypothetical protein
MFSSLHPAIRGALIGVVVALALYFIERMLLKKQAKERAIRQHKPNMVVFDSTEIARLTSVRNMCFFVPAFFAVMNWMID